MVGRGFTDEVTFPDPKSIVYNPVTKASNTEIWARPVLMRRLLRHCLGHPASLINVHKKPSTWERERAALEEAGAEFPRATRVLVAHEHTPRKAPAGIQMIDAWRYLLKS